MSKPIDSLLGDAMGGADDIRAALRRDHEQLLGHHIDEEHAEMFKQLGEHFSPEELATMGERFEAAKAAPPRRRPSRARATAAA
jgi:hypothetical protein